MVRHTLLLAALCLALAGCGDSGKPKQSAGTSKPVRMACRTIDEAAMKAQDITRKLAEGRKQGTITQDEYIAYTNTVSDGLSAWAERQDLRAYCAALQRVVTDASLQ
jgi:Tfp pilus assembly protein PilP